MSLSQHGQPAPGVWFSTRKEPSFPAKRGSEKPRFWTKWETLGQSGPFLLSITGPSMLVAPSGLLNPHIYGQQSSYDVDITMRRLSSHGTYRQMADLSSKRPLFVWKTKSRTTKTKTRTNTKFNTKTKTTKRGTALLSSTHFFRVNFKNAAKTCVPVEFVCMRVNWRKRVLYL